MPMPRMPALIAVTLAAGTLPQAAAAGDPTGFSISVHSDSPYQISVNAYDSTDTVRITAASRLQLPPRGRGELRCNTDTSCTLVMASEEPRSSMARSTGTVFDLGVGPKYTYTVTSSCVRLKAVSNPPTPCT